MSVTVNEEVEVTLLDGTKFVVRPLKISLLREFMDTFDQISDVSDNNNKSLDVLLKCVKVALKQYAPDLVDSENLEDLLDLPLVYQIVEEASGIVLSGSGSVVSNLG